MKAHNTTLDHTRSRQPSLRFSLLATKIVILALLLTVVNSSCEVTTAQQELLNQLFGPGDPPVGGGGSSGTSPNCFQESFIQPPGQLTNIVDILFVTDTSGSLQEERAGIAAGIDAFVAALPANVNYRIGVMLAHGDQSYWSGRLYRKNNQGPLVLDSMTMPLATIRSYLQQRLTNPAGDYETDGGEVGLYTVHRGLQPDRLAESQMAGFFRNDAALAVIYIADENDICSGTPPGITLVPDPNNLEIPAAVTYCSNVNAGSVLTQLRNRQGSNPLVVSGIIYTHVATVPQGGENEVGYGYIEHVELGNGVLVDLASGNYSQGLATIGEVVTLSLNLITEFTLSHSPVIENTINVAVDTQVVPHVFAPSLNEVQINEQDAGGALSEILIDYCIDPNPSGGGGCSGVGCGGGGIGV